MEVFSLPNRLKKLIHESNSTVFLGGAGVSTESGIPDFRSKDGLYSRMNIDVTPEELLSRPFFETRTTEFFKFYREEILAPHTKPNRAHYALAKMEKEGLLDAVITQNIDGLHMKAGSKNVYEVHGSFFRNYCVDCKKKFDEEYVINYPKTIPLCNVCQGIVRPDVVLYQEPLPRDVLISATKAVERADLLIVGGSSLVVFPVAGLVSVFNGKNLVIINHTKTNFDNKASLIYRDSVGEVLELALS